MKTLTLIRHAKSSWDDASISDKERPLNRRGMSDAPIIGKRMADGHLKPELVLSSSAIRAVTTAQIIAEQVGYPAKDIIVLDDLYAASAQDLLKIVSKLDESLQVVFVVGHNPGLSDLAAELTRGEVTHMPTCCAVVMQFITRKWSNIDGERHDKVHVYKPKTQK